MSVWCGKCDFRDTLSICFDDDFSKFMKATKGVIYKRQNKDIIKIEITKPADLIPYYAHIVGVMAKDPDGAYIQLGEKSYLDTRIEEINEFNEKCPEWKHSTVYYETRKAALNELYEREIKKSIESQSIIDD